MSAGRPSPLSGPPAATAGPLGVFDSGLGGLTVVRAVARELPGEPIVYFGDTARLPYGNKSAGTVQRLSVEAYRFLHHFGIKAFVVACNSASALAMEALRAEASVPVVGVVEAGSRAAVGATRSGSIGVIGTRATIGSKCYERELETLRSGLRIAVAACPLFVPLVEEGWIDDPVTRQVAERYLAPVRDAGVDTLILGCTHYPLLRAVIQDVVGDGVTLIDSGDAMAAEIESLLDSRRLRRHASDGAAPSPRFFVSDQPEQFEHGARRFLGDALSGDVRAVDPSDVPWYDRWAPPERGDV